MARDIDILEEQEVIWHNIMSLKKEKYMQKLGEESVRQIQLRILNVTARFCEENQINYWLDFGTLLGAVRHKGYIPWDDDIDIGMLRPDYEQFRKLFNKSNKKYQFFCPEDRDDFVYSCGKVADMDTVLYEPDIHGSRFFINVDVFVYDNAPDEQTSVKMFRRVKKWLFLNMLKHNLITDKGELHRKLLKYVASFLMKALPCDYFIKKIVNNARKYEFAESEKVGLFVWDEKIICDKAAVSAFTEVEFENNFFKAPENYHYWLSVLYGNYLELPPVEDRVSHHMYEAYLKE